MKTRLYNAKILSMVEGQEIFDGEIIIEDGRIVEVQEGQGFKSSKVQEVRG